VAAIPAAETKPRPGPWECADLVSGPWAAKEGVLKGHGLPLQGVQDSILLILGNVLQGVPGTVAGGSRWYPSQSHWPYREGLCPSPALSIPW
jgi:hypothetical protein